jgi:hypothetical protein
MTLIMKKGKSPHKFIPISEKKRRGRIRGSRPDEILFGIYEKGAIFKCPITGEDPAEYFMKYRNIWIPRRMHHPIPHHILKNMPDVEDPNALQYVMFGSPNGHNMLDNYMNGIVTMDVTDTQTCHVCKINSWDMFQKHKKVLRTQNHHVDNFGTLPLCPTCHAATSDHSVNDNKVLFPAEKLHELLNSGVLDLTALHMQLKKYSPKLTRDAIQFKFYAMGLQRIYDNQYIPIPSLLRRYFPNHSAKKFFEVY